MYKLSRLIDMRCVSIKNSCKFCKKTKTKKQQGFIKLSFNCIQCIWNQDLIHNIRQNIIKQVVIKIDSVL